MERPEAPGWYDDPDDETQLRYYDGILWTDHVTPRSTRRAPSPSQEPEWSAPGEAPPSATGTPYGTPQPHGTEPTSPYAAPPVGQDPYAAPPAGQSPYAAPHYARPPAATGPALDDGTPLAQWWQRLLAALLDGFITGLLTLVVGFVWVLDYAEVASRFIQDSVRAAEAGAAPPEMTAFQTEAMASLTPLLLVSLVVGLVYQTFFLVRSGATPGKMVLGTTVRKLDRPGPLTVVEALMRQVLQIGCSVVGFVPFLGLIGSVVSILDPAWLLWDPLRQALHDKVAGTVVVVKPRTR